MNDQVANNDNAALTMIGRRSMFYGRQTQLMLIALLLNVGLNFLLYGVLKYFLDRPVQPVYFNIDQSGVLTGDLPLSTPHMTTEQVAKWVIHAIESSYSYNFVTYRKELQSAQQYFTEYGWRKYMTGLEKSNNLVALTERKILAVAKVAAMPELVVEGLLNGVYAWKFQVPMVVSYYYSPYDDNSKFENPVQINVIVQRVSLLNNDYGLGIMQIIGNIPTAQ